MDTDWQAWVGRRLMAVRRELPAGPLQTVWDDRSTLTVSPSAGGPVLTAGEFTQAGPADLSRSAPWTTLIGRELTALHPGELRFGDATVTVTVAGEELRVQVQQPEPDRQWWRIEWEEGGEEFPLVIWCEIVDGIERRKVELFDEDRLGFASAWVAEGGTGLSVAAGPPLAEILADEVFTGGTVTAEQFEEQWRLAVAGSPTTTLWRPTGPDELALVEASGWRRWPPRLPDQPIFYPVTTREYATRIAREWNVPHSGVGFVTRFEVLSAFLAGRRVHEAGGSELTEWWIPAEELDDLNDHLVGRIEVVESLRRA